MEKWQVRVLATPVQHVEPQAWIHASSAEGITIVVCLPLQGVRRKNFKAVRSVVEKQLFAARPTFAGALRQIQAAVAELRSVSFAHANPNHTNTLQEYGELQAVTREQKAKPALDGIVDRIQKVHRCLAVALLSHCSSILA
jgi:hypothetical protein